MRFKLILPMLIGFTCACGGPPAWDPTGVRGSFTRVEEAVHDISALIKPAAKKKGAPSDLGSDSDRVGLYISMFMSAAKDTPLQQDAEEFTKRFNALEKLFATRAPMPKLQESLKQVEDSLATIKSKL